MNVVMIGTGYVGLVSGTCLAELGHNVCCIDKIEDKITRLKQGEVPIYEPGLKELIQQNQSNGRLTFSTDATEALESADIVFIAVGTPTDPASGQADLRYVFTAAEEIAKALTHSVTVVVKSTVPVGTGLKVKAILDAHSPQFLCHVVSNPEFLREGSAVKDFLYPDRIVVGSSSIEAAEQMKKLYYPLTEQGVPLISMEQVASAELAKYACNAYLAMRISFVNEISDLCEKLDADISDVTHAMGSDARIGPHFLKPGPGYGGSCFPKDTLALDQTANKAEAPSAMVKAAITSNEARKKRMAYKILEAIPANVKKPTIAVLGLTFKANTDDMRDSPSLEIIPELLQNNATLRLYDPEGMDEAKKIFTDSDIIWCTSAYDAMQDSDVTAIITEWPQFTTVDWHKAAQSVKTATMVDLRKVISKEKAIASGFHYITIGTALTN